MPRFLTNTITTIRSSIVLAASLIFTVPVVEAGTIVRVQTLLGVFTLELFDETAPLTTANFLNYVESGRYNLTIVHRAEPGFVIQGGNWKFDERSQDFFEIIKDGPIQNEFSILNTAGTIAMAKLGNDPDSATNEWFINLEDNPSLDTTNGGYTVFGEVVGNGMILINTISGLEPVSHPTIPFGIPIYQFDGGTVLRDDLVNVTMSVLANVYDPQTGMLTITVDAQSLGLLRVSFTVVSVEQGVIQALGESVENLTEPRGNISTYDTSTARLIIPELAVDGDIAFKDVVFVLTDNEQLLFQVESFTEVQ